MQEVYCPAVEIRTLESREREAVLELLDAWELPDGWRGRDFFRRYMEDDPSFRDENFWVAAEGARLVSCVQIFPRRLRLNGGEVGLGGIGSVFTHPEGRGSGAASAVLRAAEDDMRGRGLALGLLFTGRIPFYERLGWIAWPFSNALYIAQEADAGAAAEGVELDAFDLARDLADVCDLHAGYSAERSGSVVRDDAAWEGNLKVAGNPDEDFRVARRDGEVVAYARFIALEGHPILAEFGRGPRDEDALAALLSRALAERGGGYGPAPADASLEAGLLAHGVEVRPMGDPNTMLRCLDAEALLAAAGAERAEGESEADLLRRVLPPERALFWPADRF